MIESPLGELLDEFAPDASGEVVDDDPLPVPEVAKRKRRKGKHPEYGFRCPCPDCCRQQPARAAFLEAKKVAKR